MGIEAAKQVLKKFFGKIAIRFAGKTAFKWFL
jgi:hypothetical protein